ncbi:MAG: hypothetical protein JJ896_18175 [Rhodothermales bacterium]|nr:hypothetical protein [Rhodothermales bacterium]MBO6781591.1 hypothetical protein [Rhodothermales bacterium]
MKENHFTACESWQPVMVDVLFGDADEAVIANHLRECPTCAAEFRSLQETLELTADRPAFAPEEAVLARLEERVLTETARHTLRPLPMPRMRRLPAWTYRMVAVAAVLVIGIAIGRLIPQEETSAPNASLPLTAQLTPVEARAHSYLDRSKTVLLGVVNFDPATDNPASLNLPQRSAIASELLQEANFLKTTLSESEQQRLRALVSELEIILLQLANLEERVDVPELEIMKAGVDQNALLFKIDVEQMRRTVSKPETRKDPGAAV